MRVTSTVDEVDRFFRIRAEQHRSARGDATVLARLAALYSTWADRVRSHGRWRRDYLLSWVADELSATTRMAQPLAHYTRLALSEVLLAIRSLQAPGDF